MESHVKKKETSSFDEKELQQIVIPLKQMIHEDDDEVENCIGETLTCLTGRVRACYLQHLEKTLLKNYEICCEKGSAQWRLSPEDVVRCAVRMEQKALRSCMVVILYQRAMTRLILLQKSRHLITLAVFMKSLALLVFDLFFLILISIQCSW